MLYICIVNFCCALFVKFLNYGWSERKWRLGWLQVHASSKHGIIIHLKAVERIVINFKRQPRGFAHKICAMHRFGWSPTSWTTSSRRIQIDKTHGTKFQERYFSQKRNWIKMQHPLKIKIKNAFLGFRPLYSDRRNCLPRTQCTCSWHAIYTSVYKSPERCR